MKSFLYVFKFNQLKYYTFIKNFLIILILLSIQFFPMIVYNFFFYRLDVLVDTIYPCKDN
jgi:hypothetical protein